MPAHPPGQTRNLGPMTMIAQLLAAGPTWSVEFFPPRDLEAEAQLDHALGELGPLRPSFASVTYGALGTTRERTRDLVVGMNARYAFPTMAHLTCIGHTRDQISTLLDEYAANGVRNILALGGDPPSDPGSDPGEFRHALELVEMIAAHPADFSVAVAAHPEVHPNSPSRESDRRHLAAKLAAADFAITQFFFSVDHYLRLMDDLRRLGCDRPVVPGVMPFTSAAGLRRMAGMNGTEIPTTLADRIARASSADDLQRLGIEVASQLGRELLEVGAPGIHLYTLNRSVAVSQICSNLDLAVA